jgi:hypothetical protein
MFLPLSSIFEYLSASPTSRCIVESEGVLAESHLIICGVQDKFPKKWNIRANCLQTSAVKSDHHKINDFFFKSEDYKVKIEAFTCSCIAGVSESYFYFVLSGILTDLTAYHAKCNCLKFCNLFLL